MHSHVEIIIPPTDDIETAVKLVMDPFNEDQYQPTTAVDDDYEGAYERGYEDGQRAGYGWWDWYRIGGRWSGEKVKSRIGVGRLTEFRQALADRGTTISGVQFGKPRLAPPDQIAEVDRMWQEWFPDCGEPSCILFDHAPELLDSDVCAIADMPPGLTASKVVVGAPDFVYDEAADAGEFTGELRPLELMLDKVWTGKSILTTEWGANGAKVIEVVEKCRERYSHQEALTIGDDWLAVTVDSHS